MQNYEIEHKYILNPEDWGPLLKKVRLFENLNYKKISTLDRYFLNGEGTLLRHRYDSELNEWTLKKPVPDGKNTIRMEWNLPLSPSASVETCDVFLKEIGFEKRVILAKNSEIFNFSDCEMVLYQVQKEGDQALPPKFYFEIEAKGGKNVAHSLEILETRFNSLQFPSLKREYRNLFQIFNPPMDILS